MPDPIVIIVASAILLAVVAAIAAAAMIVASVARSTIDSLRAYNQALLEEIQAARDDARKGAEREHQLYRELATAKAMPVGVTVAEPVSELIRLMSDMTKSLQRHDDGPPLDLPPISEALANFPRRGSFRDAIGQEGGGS